MEGSQRPLLAFLLGFPIAILGGLIGLGGAEFRLPVLAGPLRYPARRAVPLNLAVSLITIVAALATRGLAFPWASLADHSAVVVTLIAGSVPAAVGGAALARRLDNRRLEQVILVLLVSIGLALIVEGLLPQTSRALLPNSLSWRVGGGLLLGSAIGLVSSLLGVAGGELIIPTLIFLYGVDIKLAGTASLLVSLPTVAVRIWRFSHAGAYSQRRDLRGTVAPMGAGSILGAVAGGLLVGWIPAAALKVGLGVILNLSAIRIFHSASAPGRPRR